MVELIETTLTAFIKPNMIAFYLVLGNSMLLKKSLKLLSKSNKIYKMPQIPFKPLYTP